MSEHRYCRICGQPASEDTWVELAFLGRFWMCSKHMKDAIFTELAHVGWAYQSKCGLFVIGPYPYGESTLYKTIRKAG